MEALKNIWNGLDWSFITDTLLSIIPALICITLHELSHGFAAYKLGDNTAKRMGRLTLNPLRHIDVFGLLMMVLFKFGWAKPVPVNMNNFKNPKRGMAVTAAAGPLANVVICCAALFIYGLAYAPLVRAGTGFASAVLSMIGSTAYLSLALAVFNIIPIPPLDGSKVLFSVLSEKNYYRLMRYEKYGMILLMVVVASGVLRTPLAAATQFLFDKLFVIAELGFKLADSLM